MTYFGVLILFILPLMTVLMLAVLYSDQRKGRPVNWRPYLAIIIHVLLALIYTTPWDNYLVATGVWWYNPDLVHGLRIGWVPIEEYVFFVVQTMLTGFWLVSLIRWGVTPRSLPAHQTRRSSALRAGASTAILLVWLVFTIILFSGWQPGRYLALILSWALLPVLLQVTFGADLLWANRRLVLLGVLPTTLYLWLVDAVAIRSGTWTIDPAQTTGWMAGPLPVEEMVFFFMTNLLIVFGVTLFLAPESRERARRLAAWLACLKTAPCDPQAQGAD